MKTYKKLTLPYLIYAILFIIIPVLIMIIFSISNIDVFSPIKFKLSDFKLNFEAFGKLIEVSFFKSFLRSFIYSFFATLLTLLIAYPLALIISNMKSKYKFILLLVFVMPMWTNMLLRVTTINNLLKENSFLKSLLGFSIDLTNFKSLKIILTMTICYLPFMLFPIYTVLEKADKSLLEASQDLGASPFKTFYKITLPLSLKGIISGVMMVFLPSMMSFTIPQIITDGDPKYTMIGQLIERQFLSSQAEYNVGSLISLILLAIILGCLMLLNKFDDKNELLAM